MEKSVSDSTPPPEPLEAATGGPAGQKKPPRWIIVGLLVLLAGWFSLTQAIQRTGVEIDWGTDLAQAEAEAKEAGRRVFLLLHEPACATTADNERNLFSNRQVRNRLAEMVCCRVELGQRDPLRARFMFKDKPLMLVIQPGVATPLGRLEGKVSKLQFDTYVDPGGDDRDGG